MKNLVLSMVGLTLCVACTSGASVSEGAAKGAPLTQLVSTSPVPEEPAASMVPQPALSTESAAAVDGPSAETFLATLCEKRDFEAVRFYDGTSDEVSLTPKLALCRAEAFLTVDRLELAREAVAPMLLRADPMAYRARALLSDYYERLGRFDSIVELYTSTQMGDDPRALRNLGVAYLRLGSTELLDNLLPESRPAKTDAWRWVWWLRVIDGKSNPSLSQLELETLLAELPTSSVTYEVSQLRPLLTQAYRRGQWLGAAKRCTQASEVLENENRALKMARTSVAAAVRGDGSVWEATLSCALKLALLTERPEETCQEIHREQIDWSVRDKLSTETVAYPDSSECGWQDAAIRDWIQRWQSAADLEQRS